MPPEQIHNQALTTASDLYSLGATLICLVTGTQSADIGSLINLGNNRLEFKQKISGYSFQFLQWLEKMVAPDPNQRYSSAEIALEKLQFLSITLVPEVRLSSHELNFQAIRLGENLTQTIQITNPIPDTILQGQWEVAPHRSDPPHNPDSHAWISFSRKEFRGNDIKCNITVDTSKLKADKSYERKLVLRSNSTPEIDTLKIKVKTASISVEIQRRSYASSILNLAAFLLFCYC
jgi:serine/threonine protein kinase